MGTTFDLVKVLFWTAFRTFKAIPCGGLLHLPLLLLSISQMASRSQESESKLAPITLITLRKAEGGQEVWRKAE